MAFGLRTGWQVGVVLALLLAGGGVRSGEEAGTGQPSYADAEAGYSLVIPYGWRKVTEREVRQLFRGMLKAFGKQALEAALQRPPVYFEGPDPRDTMKVWANFGVGYIPTPVAIDPNQLPAYREQIENQFRTDQVPYDDVKLDAVKIDGSLSLKINYMTRRQTVSPLKMLVSHILIPAEDRTLEVVFIFDPSQKEEMDKIVDQVLDSFRLMRGPKAAMPGRWGRIALLTAIGFAAGVVLGLVLQRLTKRPAAAGAGKGP